MRDLHTHTTYSDGNNSPEEMVKAAISLGLDAIGISDHSYTSFDESYCMQLSNIAAYNSEITDLKEKYSSQIEVLCGIEQDYYSDFPADRYDYCIGSVHYLCCGKPDGVFIPVDESPEILLEAADRYFHGDIYALAAEYFRTVGNVVNKTGCDIIGHFDLISKFNEGDKLFNSKEPAYIHAWMSAADKLIESRKPFEINTGAMSRGYRSLPYPSYDIINYILANRGRLILSSDAHSTSAIAYRFSALSRIFV